MKRKTPKSRNPFVQHLLKKKAGAHTKPYKTERAKAKVDLRKQVNLS